MNYRQLKAIEAANKNRILKICPDITENSGIYVFTRIDENGIRYAYVGQAKHLLTRAAQHLSGYQHIDLSLKKHGLFSAKKLYGWKLDVYENPIELLDEEEQKFIKLYSDNGFQLRNKTAGGQGKGKHGLDNNKPSKGYHDGLKQGYANAQKFITNLFDKHLDVSKKSPKPNKNQDKALQKFYEFIGRDL